MDTEKTNMEQLLEWATTPARFEEEAVSIIDKIEGFIADEEKQKNDITEQKLELAYMSSQDLYRSEEYWIAIIGLSLLAEGEWKNESSMIAKKVVNKGFMKTIKELFPLNIEEHEHPAKFARWILKYSKDHFDAAGGLCHLLDGKELTTMQVYEIYKDTGGVPYQGEGGFPSTLKKA